MVKEFIFANGFVGSRDQSLELIDMGSSVLS